MVEPPHNGYKFLCNLLDYKPAHCFARLRTWNCEQTVWPSGFDFLVSRGSDIKHCWLCSSQKIKPSARASNMMILKFTPEEHSGIKILWCLGKVWHYMVATLASGSFSSIPVHQTSRGHLSERPKNWRIWAVTTRVKFCHQMNIFLVPALIPLPELRVQRVFS